MLNTIKFVVKDFFSPLVKIGLEKCILGFIVIMPLVILVALWQGWFK